MKMVQFLICEVIFDHVITSIALLFGDEFYHINACILNGFFSTILKVSAVLIDYTMQSILLIQIYEWIAICYIILT